VVEHTPPADYVGSPADGMGSRADGVGVELPQGVRDAISARMEALDPNALLSFAVTCPDCAHAWRAPLNVGEAFWTELQTSVERTLLEVDALARAYGWTEPQVLALTATRRAAYLQLAGAT
jgi:hypothetical protein